MIAAIRNGKEDVVKYLTDNGAAVDTKDLVSLINCFFFFCSNSIDLVRIKYATFHTEKTYSTNVCL